VCDFDVEYLKVISTMNQRCIDLKILWHFDDSVGIYKCSWFICDILFDTNCLTCLLFSPFAVNATDRYV